MCSALVHCWNISAPERRSCSLMPNTSLQRTACRLPLSFDVGHQIFRFINSVEIRNVEQLV